ncbi:Caleosin related protein-domain-containing protein [Penicillium cinerascens]|uniref:Caleosin related protein-domain-containing protein n=1 Tax=Penicillium cinerascens TaxID=70096 RepID=A0A9W9JEM5_9EURO|nr:Caleosin related protein-domain-containing protein [Penicillium cinerascens]KAJ5195485.1 Caleosin related protein-domain-containing protein [Penicillium cinerascens]
MATLKGLGFQLSVDNAPVTGERLPAATLESDSSDGDSESSIQRHIDFWDRDGDGRISLADTWIGLHDLGFSMISSAIVTVASHASLTVPSSLAVTHSLDPYLGVYVAESPKYILSILSGKCFYDEHGRFCPTPFEEVFASSSERQQDSLDTGEIQDFVKRRRRPTHLAAWVVTVAEWHIVALFRQDGTISKTRLRQIYDGSILSEIRQTRKVSHALWPLSEVEKSVHGPAVIYAARHLLLISIAISKAVVMLFVSCIGYGCLNSITSKDFRATVYVWTIGWTLLAWRSLQNVARDKSLF